MGAGTKDVPIYLPDHGIHCLAQLRAALGNGIQHRLHIGRRIRDHPQNLGRCCLPLERLGDLFVTRLGQFLRFAQLHFGPLALGDICVRRDETAVRQGVAANLNHGAVRAGALEGMGFETLGEFDALLDLLLDIARTVLTALRLVAKQILQIVTSLETLGGYVKKFQILSVVDHELEVGIKHADALTHIFHGRF